MVPAPESKLRMQYIIRKFCNVDKSYVMRYVGITSKTGWYTCINKQTRHFNVVIGLSVLLGIILILNLITLITTETLISTIPKTQPYSNLTVGHLRQIDIFFQINRKKKKETFSKQQKNIGTLFFSRAKKCRRGYFNILEKFENIFDKPILVKVYDCA